MASESSVNSFEAGASSSSSSSPKASCAIILLYKSSNGFLDLLSLTSSTSASAEWQHSAGFCGVSAASGPDPGIAFFTFSAPSSSPVLSAATQDFLASCVPSFNTSRYDFMNVIIVYNDIYSKNVHFHYFF